MPNVRWTCGADPGGRALGSGAGAETGQEPEEPELLGGKILELDADEHAAAGGLAPVTDLGDQRGAPADSEDRLDLEMDLPMAGHTVGVDTLQPEGRAVTGEVDDLTVLPRLPLAEAVPGDPVGRVAGVLRWSLMGGTSLAMIVPEYRPAAHL